MRRWRLLCFVLVAVLAVVVWEMLPWPTAQAQMMKLPPGVTLKEKNFDVMGMPGVKKVTWNRLEIKPGASWPNVDMGAKVWDFCYTLAGTFTVTGADGKISTITAGTAYTVPAGAKIPLIANKGKVTAIDLFWEIETQ
jgi:mannose-6-phosphate isomerase-like protein (cupin superfamily)